MVQPRDDQLVEKLVPDFVTRGEGIPIWKLADLGSFFDPDDLLLTLRFDDHRLLDPGTPGNYFVAERGERILNAPANAAATSRGALHFVPSVWPYAHAVRVEKATVNECINPSFELNTTFWASASAGTITRTNVQALFGTYSLLCESGGGQTYAQAAYGGGVTAFSAVEDYTMSCWYHNDDLPTGGLVQYLVNWQGGANPAATTTVNIGIVQASGWHYVFGTLTPDFADRTGATFYIRLLGATINGQGFYLDGFQIEQNQDYPTSTCIGDMGDGYFWSGTPHASTSAHVANYLDADAYVDLISGNNTFSIAMWVQMPYDSDVTWPQQYSYISSIWQDVNNRLAIVYDDVAEEFAVYFSGAWLITIGTTFSAGDWIHIVGTFDFSADEYVLYIDGVLGGTDTTALVALAVNQWDIGAYAGTDTGQGGFAFAEYVVFDRVLTNIEAANLYALRHPVIDPGAVDKGLSCGIVVYKTASQVTTGAWDIIQIDTIEYNERMVFDTVNYRIYITQPGWYTVSGCIEFNSLADGDAYGVGLRLNGATWIGITGTSIGAAGGAEATAYRSIHLVPGDYLELLGATTPGGITMLASVAYSLRLQIVRMRNSFSEK